MEPFRFCMARKLRLERGDFVILKVTHGEGFIFGRVDKVYRNNKEDWSKWGVYGYTIMWDDDQPSNSGWTITDLLKGRIKYIRNRKALQALYGSKSIQKDQ